MGARRDGTLTAVQQKAVVNAGAAASPDNYYVTQVIWHTANLHACPNVYLEQVGVYTNRQITGPTRSPMNMQAIFALESHMERMAAELGMDPYQFRMKNYSTYQTVAADESRDVSQHVKSFDAHVPYSSKILDECMELGTRAIDWEREASTSHQPGGS
jgi:CO/xanthine dehydrogenase Mo-binding subunit